MSLGYRYTVDDAGCEVFHRLSRRQRESMLVRFRELAAHPFTRGDYQETGARGEPLDVALFENEFLLTWHVDHAVKQVRIVALEVV